MKATIYQVRDEAATKSGVRYVVKFESPFSRSVCVGFKGLSEIVEFLVRSGVKQNWTLIEDSLREDGYWSEDISLQPQLETVIMQGVLALPGV